MFPLKFLSNASLGDDGKKDIFSYWLWARKITHEGSPVLPPILYLQIQ
jgi:hypothetical protein